MLAMVNGGADLRATATATAAATSEQENSYHPPKAIPVPVLVAHEKHSGALQDQHDRHDQHHHLHHHARRLDDGPHGGSRGGDSGSSFLRPPLATATNTIGNLSSSSHHDSHATSTSGDTESDSSAKASASAAARSKEKRSTKSKCPPGLRSGKWTPEEEAFTNLLIHFFKRGLLHIEDGTSLRWYLAKRLNCEAMRVTKKLKGNSSIGKQIFRALEPSEGNLLAIKHAAEELAIVENLFLDSLAVTAAAPQPSNHLVASYLPRVKKLPPPQRTGALGLLQHPPSLAAKKLRQHPAGGDASEDARLLLHFFEGAKETTADDDDDDDDDEDEIDEDAAAATPAREKKRLLGDLASSQSSDARTSDVSGGDDEDDDAAAPPASKRQFVQIANLMG